MIILYILLGIALLIALILSLRIKLRIIYENEICVYLRILFFKIPILPETDNKLNLFKRKRDEKDALPKVFDDIKNANAPSNALVDKLNSIRDILSVLFENFHHRLHVKLSKIHIRVATGDAAKTAILYGAVSTSVACIIDVIDDFAKLKPIKDRSVSVEPDFLSDKSSAKVNILLYMRVGSIIKMFLNSFIDYYSSKEKTQINNRKE